MPHSERAWWELLVSHPSGEEVGFLLIECGAAGLSVEADSHLRVFAQGDRETIETLRSKATALGFSVHSAQILEPVNWTHNCRELWQAERIGKIKIVPLLETDRAPTSSGGAADIFILPGTAFGTGHHASTALLIEMLQQEELFPLRPRSALDLGTGSGILALTAHKLFNCSVCAVDPDRDALENAADNLRLNAINGGIQLLHGDIRVVTGSYDLIMANIYAEVLGGLAADLAGHMTPQGRLLMSGIMASQEALATDGYYNLGFKLEARCVRDDWVALAWSRGA